jgi:hypothetical protein
MIQTILEPAAALIGVSRISRWRPLESLKGKVIGFIDNSKPSCGNGSHDACLPANTASAARRTRRKAAWEALLIPISLTPEDIGIIVAGAPGTHSVYVPAFGQTREATRVIQP